MNITNNIVDLETKEVCKRKQKEYFDLKIKQYNMQGIKYQVELDDLGNIINVNTDQLIINPNNSIAKLSKDKNQDSDKELDQVAMPTHCLNIKEYNPKAFAILSIKSKGESIMHNNKRIFVSDHRYTYKNDINLEKIAKEFKISKSTLYKNLKVLEKLDCDLVIVENTPNGIVYKLQYGIRNTQTGNMHKYVVIQNKMLKELVTSIKTQAFKIYCLLAYILDTDTFKPITEAWICTQLGLNSNSESNQSSVRTMIKTLEKCKFIETKKIKTFVYDEIKAKQIPKINKVFRLCTFEEWNSLDEKL